jgi:N-acetyl-gamma-glutamylphosphate reductase
VILGLAPLARCGWLSGAVIADSKSGVSGAGRKPTLKTHFVEASENLSPYSIGRTHRHAARWSRIGAPGRPKRRLAVDLLAPFLPVNRDPLDALRQPHIHR